MKKRIVIAGFAVMVGMAASAQAQKEAPPKPPAAPKPPVEKLSEVPPPPPPSEPPPPPPPPAPPTPEAAGELDDFAKRNPSIKNIHRHNDELTIRHKSGKEERYNLADEKSRKEAEAKYGELPPPPPPAPVPAAPPPPPKPPKKKSTLS